MVPRRASWFLALLVFMAACGGDNSETGVSTQSTRSAGLLAAPCPVLEYARDLQPEFQEHFVDQARARVRDQPSQELVDTAIGNLQSDDRYGGSFQESELDIVMSISDGSGARIYVNFSEPVDLPSDLGLPPYGGEEMSDEGKLGSDGQVILAPVEDERIFHGVNSAELAVDSSGTLEYIIPSQEELWCSFDPEEMLQG